MQTIPTLDVPSQTLTVLLGNQRCQLAIYEKTTYRYGTVPDLNITAVTGGELTDQDGDTLTIGQSSSIVADVAPVQLVTTGLTYGPALYMDIAVNDAILLSGVPCLNATPIVISRYLGFTGDLVFYDTQGTDDPVSSGLGSRWFLTYLD